MTKSIHVCATLALCLAGAPGVDVARAADALGMIETRGVFSPGQADILVGLAIDGFSNVGPGEVELAVQVTALDCADGFPRLRDCSRIRHITCELAATAPRQIVPVTLHIPPGRYVFLINASASVRGRMFTKRGILAGRVPGGG